MIGKKKKSTFLEKDIYVYNSIIIYNSRNKRNKSFSCHSGFWNLGFKHINSDAHSRNAIMGLNHTMTPQETV